MDILGERWTILVVRELLLGPKRFGDLHRRLEGAGPNRLTQRLRLLQANGVIDKTAGGAYALTAAGEGLREPVVALAIWGLGLIAGADLSRSRPDMVALCISGAVDPRQLDGMDLTCEFDVGDTFTVGVRDSRMTVVSGSTTAVPAVRFRSSPAIFLALVTGRLDLDAAIRARDVHLDGQKRAAVSLVSVFVETCRAHVDPGQVS